MQYCKEAVVDSLIWIGSKSERDKYREESENILKAYFKGKIGKIYVTDFIILETVNFLLRKERFEKSLKALNLFLQSDRVEIVYVDELMLQDIKKIFENYEKLSLVDCSIIVLMREKEIKHLFSFDSHFDGIKGILRMETI